METAFGFTPEEYAWFGGYPGSAAVYKDEVRWKDYINHSLIDTSISRDILLMTRINKPALLRNLFFLGCQYSGQILSYTKMIGQLHDAGNTTTLADYLYTLGSAGLLTGLEKFSGSRVMKRSSSPKFQVLNTALISAQNPLTFIQALQDQTFWGRIIESAVGAHLFNGANAGNYQVYYWREGNREVDFVLQKGSRLIAIEVKSGLTNKIPGIQSFSEAYPQARLILIGPQGIPWQQFLGLNPEELFHDAL
jgi:predicted AAA+ superfamily ATPase